MDCSTRHFEISGGGGGVGGGLRVKPVRSSGYFVLKAFRLSRADLLGSGMRVCLTFIFITPPPPPGMVTGRGLRN